MDGFIGIGKESTPGPATSPTKTIPFLQGSQESCAICDRIDERVNMHYVGWAEDEDAAAYVCSDPHPIAGPKLIPPTVVLKPTKRPWRVWRYSYYGASLKKAFRWRWTARFYAWRCALAGTPHRVVGVDDRVLPIPQMDEFRDELRRAAARKIAESKAGRYALVCIDPSFEEVLAPCCVCGEPVAWGNSLLLPGATIDDGEVTAVCIAHKRCPESDDGRLV